jgi:hypothetical protein
VPFSTTVRTARRGCTDALFLPPYVNNSAMRRRRSRQSRSAWTQPSYAAATTANATWRSASRKLWHALHAVDKYLKRQAAWLVNYAKRLRAGLRVGTSITEGTVNFLVNRRMNKSQQMRWSRMAPILQVRCAVYNGTLGAAFGHRFDRISNADLTIAKAA